MKKIIALLMALILCCQAVPFSAARAESTPATQTPSLWQEIETYGSVDKAMDAYAAKQLKYYQPIFDKLSYPGLLAFRSMAEKFRMDSGSLADAIGNVMLSLGYAYAENDGNWKLKEQQVGLYIKYLLMLAEMETMTFEEAAARAHEVMPRRDVVMDEINFLTDLLGVGLDALGDSFLHLGKEFFGSKEMFKGGDLIYQVFERGMKANTAINATGETATTVLSLFEGNRALPQVLDAYQRQVSAQMILEAVGEGDCEELNTAITALTDTYADFESELAKMSASSKARKNLNDPDYLNNLFQKLLKSNTETYLQDTVITVLDACGRIADVFLAGGLGSVTTKGLLHLGEDMLGTKSAYTHLHAMSTIDEIFQSMLDGSYDKSSWQGCVSYANNVRRMSTLAMVGETHVYTLNTENAGAIREFWNMIEKAVSGEDPLANTHLWYERVTASMEEVSLAADEYVNDLMAHYAALCSASADVSSLLGHENETKGELSGVLTKDLWFALPDGSGKPDKENENPDAGEPVKDTTVQLKCGDRVLDTTVTDDSGYYKFTYLRSAVNGKLTIVVDPDEKDYATLEINGPVYNNITMPSYYRWNADRQAPVAGADTLAPSLPYADDYFLDPAYSHDLALASLGLSAAANDSGMIAAAFGQMGFSVSASGGFDAPANTLENTVPYTIATKAFEDPDARNDEPKEYCVVALCVGSALETAGLSHALSAGSLQTAREAAKPILKALEKVIQANYNKDVPMRLWLMGFSFGGKVADSVYAQMMLKESVMGKYTLAGAYTFAAPGGQALQGYNFVYEQDPVGMGLTDPTAKTITFGSIASESARQQVSSHFHVLTKGNTAYDPDSYTNTSALTALLRENAFPGEMLFTAAAWRMLQGESGTDFRLTDAEARHQAAEALAPVSKEAKALAEKTLNSMPLPVFKALPEEIEAEMETLLSDVAALYLAAGGKTTDDAARQLMQLLIALWEDLGNPTSYASSMYAHHPEMYLAWLMGVESATLTGYEEPRAFDARVLQLPFNLQGTVLNDETGMPIPNVKVTVSGEKNKTKTYITDENGYWKALVKPDTVKLKFQQPGFKTVKETAVVPQVQPEEVEMRYTYMKKTDIPVLILTTDNVQEANATYRIDIGRPKVWSSVNDQFSAQFDAAIDFLYADQKKEISSARKTHCSVHDNQQLASTHIKPNNVYCNGEILSLYMSDGGFDCCIGHNWNNILGFTFDIRTGKSLMLDDLFDPENPNAEQDFIEVLGQVDQYYASIKKKIYTHLLKPETNRSKYASWSLYYDGLHISVENLNIGVLEINGTTIPYEKLKGILNEKYLPGKTVGGGVVTFEEGDVSSYRNLINTPDGKHTVLLKGLVTQIWIDDNTHLSHQDYSDRFRYFYAYGLDDAAIALPGNTIPYNGKTGFSVQWEDAQGVHHIHMGD